MGGRIRVKTGLLARSNEAHGARLASARGTRRHGCDGEGNPLLRVADALRKPRRPVHDLYELVQDAVGGRHGFELRDGGADGLLVLLGTSGRQHHELSWRACRQVDAPLAAPAGHDMATGLTLSGADVLCDSSAGIFSTANACAGRCPRHPRTRLPHVSPLLPARAVASAGHYAYRGSFACVMAR